MNILEEFWYGNIEPAEYDTSSGKEYKELLQLISRNEDKLLATMTEEQKELFTKYADCVREYQVMTECLLFQNSFRLGSRMMLEVMRDGMTDLDYRTSYHLKTLPDETFCKLFLRCFDVEVAERRSALDNLYGYIMKNSKLQSWIRCSRSKICSSAAQDAKVSAGTVTAVVVLQLTNRKRSIIAWK